MTASLAQALTVATAAPATADTPVPGAVASPDEALAAARRGHKPVVVSSLLGPQREVRALPDGKFEATFHARPVRALRKGKWAGIDTKLRRQSDGSLMPGVTTVGLRFSGGGDGPFVRMTRAGKELALAWPYGKLPTPTVDGDTATYSNVFKDVDLVVRATPSGFSHVLRVKTPQAAQQPQLTKIELKLNAAGMALKGDGGGGLTAVDQAAGGTVFQAAKPVMWDSSSSTSNTTPSGNDSAAPRKAAVPSSSSTPSAKPTPSPSTKGASDAPQGGDPSDGPADGSKQALIKASVAGGKLALEPDKGLLTGAGTRFPVYIDPDWQAPGESAAVMVGTRYSDAHWEDEGMGLCDDADPYMGGQCGGRQTKRLFYKFVLPSGVRNSNILTVEFKPYQTHGYNCTPAEAEVWKTKGVSGSTSWGTQSASGFWQRKLVERSFNYGNEDVGCANNTVVLQDARLKDEVQKAADGSGTIWLGMKAGDEGSTKGWKRFNNDAVLRVLYNLPPKVPTGLGISAEGSNLLPCGDNDATKPYVRVWPTLSAKITDPQSSDRVQAEFLIGWGDGNGGGFKWRIGASGMGPDSSPLVSGGGNSGRTFTKALSTLASQRAIPKNLPIAWIVRGHDFKDNQENDDWHNWQGSGPWSDAATSVGGKGHKCWFVYDDAAPPPPKVESAKFPADGAEHDGVNQTGEFTITAQGTEPIAKFSYYFTPPGGAPGTMKYLTLGSTSGCTGNKCTFNWAPDRKGDWKLDVRAIDRAGRQGDAPTYNFRVRQVAGEQARWRLDDPAGSTDLMDEIAYSDTYQLSSVHSGKCLDVNGQSKEDGPTGKAVQWDCSGALSQRWRLQSAGGDDYKLVNINSGKCAAVGADGDGAEVWQWSCYDTNDETWKRVKNGDGFNLVSKRSGRCIDVLGASTENGGTIVQWECNNTDNQRWNITSIDNTYELAAVHSGKCLDVNGQSKENGPTGKTVQWKCSGALSQRWRLEPAGKDEYKLVNINSGKCAAVGADGDGAEIWQWNCVESNDEVWKRVKNGDGFNLVSKRSGRCIDVLGASAEDGITIVQWECNNTDNQRWKLLSLNKANLVGTDYSLGNAARVGSNALKLNADNDPNTVGYAETAVPMIDPTKSFSVSAWAKLNKDEGHQAVTSQDGQTESAFQLEYIGGNRDTDTWTNKWAAVVRNKDAKDAVAYATYSNEQARVGQWVHLVGVHDSTAKTLSLYVDGKLQGSPIPVDMSAWANASRGRFVIGRTIWQGLLVDHFNGEIDDVRVFDRAVTAENVAGWYRSTTQARWRLNGPAGQNATVGDDSGAGHSLSLHGGAEIKSDGELCQITEQCLQLSGNQQWAQTSGQVVRTDGSFTIAGWVDAARPRVPMTVFSAAGSKQSAFTVRFNPKVAKNPNWDPDRDDPADEYVGGWQIEMPDRDGDNPVRATAYHSQSCNICTDSGPDHLMLSYDAGADTMTLYVNGNPELTGTNSSAKTGVVAFNAGGPLQLGRRFADGQTADDSPSREYFSGLIDDVWVFKGALSKKDDLDRIRGGQEIETPYGNPPLPCTYDATTLDCPDDA